MADEPVLATLPQAVVVRKRRMRFSIVWLIPILAGLVAIGIAVQRVISQGPVITIEFKSASGIEAGKTFIKYKDVRIGLVSAVELSEDYSKVLVKAKIAKHSAGLMVEDAKFWVVEPRISLSGVSGLNTLLSGNYIGFQAGKSEESQRSFRGLDEPPTIKDQPGRRFVLKARELGSLGVGDPVYYRGLQVGQVAATTLVQDGRSIEIVVFVDAPYDKYVTAETRFWNASGVDVTVGADGVNVRTESLASLLAGGVAFDSPDYLTLTGPAAENQSFPIYRNRVIAMKQPDPIEQRFVLYFNESVRGLSVGAPVTLYGLRVGEVTAVGLHFEPSTKTFRPRVLITFFPDLLIARMSARQQVDNAKSLQGLDAAGRMKLLRQMVDTGGLRAQLKTGSFNAIGSEVKEALTVLTQTLKDAKVLVQRLDAKLVPDLAKTLEDMRTAIGSADRVLKNTDSTLFGKESPAPQDLRDTLQEVTRAARSVRVLVDYLERHPEMLIRGKKEEKP